MKKERLNTTIKAHADFKKSNAVYTFDFEIPNVSVYTFV